MPCCSGSPNAIRGRSRNSTIEERQIATPMARIGPGVIFPGHHHSGPEECYVISGDVIIQGRHLHAGDFHHADGGSEHDPITSMYGGEVLLVVGPRIIRARSDPRRFEDMHMMKTGLVLSAMVLLSSSPAAAQAVAGAERARPVTGDPGVSSMSVIDRPEFRVLRDYAEPGATRRLHSHEGTTYHVFVLITGQLLLTVEGESPVEVTQGQALYLKGGAKHTFKNTGAATATIVEIFGKAPAKAGDEAAARAVAAALAGR